MVHLVPYHRHNEVYGARQCQNLAPLAAGIAIIQFLTFIVDELTNFSFSCVPFSFKWAFVILV